MPRTAHIACNARDAARQVDCIEVGSGVIGQNQLHRTPFGQKPRACRAHALAGLDTSAVRFVKSNGAVMSPCPWQHGTWFVLTASACGKD